MCSSIRPFVSKLLTVRCKFLYMTARRLTAPPAACSMPWRPCMPSARSYAAPCGAFIAPSHHITPLVASVVTWLTLHAACSEERMCNPQTLNCGHTFCRCARQLPPASITLHAWKSCYKYVVVAFCRCWCVSTIGACILLACGASSSMCTLQPKQQQRQHLCITPMVHSRSHTEIITSKSLPGQALTTHRSA